MAVLLIAAFALMFVGFFGYNPIRKKWAGVIGVGGAYIITLGILLGVSLIGSIIGTILGAPTGGTSVVEVLLIVVFAVLCLGYMVYVMLTRCQTVAQRILLPFVALLIGFGFCWRLLAAIFLHMPMESGTESNDGFAFPKYLYDQADNPWELMNSGGDGANYYCQKTGETRMFYNSDFDLGSPSGFYVK